jgi:hypothetical protein
MGGGWVRPASGSIWLLFSTTGRWTRGYSRDEPSGLRMRDAGTFQAPPQGCSSERVVRLANGGWDAEETHAVGVGNIFVGAVEWWYSGDLTSGRHYRKIAFAVESTFSGLIVRRDHAYGIIR